MRLRRSGSAPGIYAVPVERESNQSGSTERDPCSQIFRVVVATKRVPHSLGPETHRRAPFRRSCPNSVSRSRNQGSARWKSFASGFTNGSRKPKWISTISSNGRFDLCGRISRSIEAVRWVENHALLPDNQAGRALTCGGSVSRVPDSRGSVLKHVWQ